MNELTYVSHLNITLNSLGISLTGTWMKLVPYWGPSLWKSKLLKMNTLIWRLPQIHSNRSWSHLLIEPPLVKIQIAQNAFYFFIFGLWKETLCYKLINGRRSLLEWHKAWPHLCSMGILEVFDKQDYSPGWHLLNPHKRTLGKSGAGFVRKMCLNLAELVSLNGSNLNELENQHGEYFILQDL